MRGKRREWWGYDMCGEEGLGAVDIKKEGGREGRVGLERGKE